MAIKIIMRASLDGYEFSQNFLLKFYCGASKPSSLANAKHFLANLIYLNKRNSFNSIRFRSNIFSFIGIFKQNSLHCGYLCLEFTICPTDRFQIKKIVTKSTQSYNRFLFAFNYNKTTEVRGWFDISSVFTMHHHLPSGIPFWFFGMI